MKEVVSHYIYNGSDVYCVLLDATNAFDKVHYGKLFRLLMDRNIPAYCIRLILDSYMRHISVYAAQWGAQWGVI